MKTLMMVVLAALLLMGCEKKDVALEKKVQELEKRMEQNNAVQKEIDTKMLDLIGKLDSRIDSATNETEFVKAFLFTELANEETSIERISNSVSGGRPAIKSAASSPSLAAKNGVPVSVYNQIVSDAQKEWPGDYEMQNYTISKQCTAWRSLHGQ